MSNNAVNLQSFRTCEGEGRDQAQGGKGVRNLSCKKNDRIKQDRPLTMKLFEVTVIQSPLNLTALSDVRGLSILKRCRFITRHIRRLAR